MDIHFIQFYIKKYHSQTLEDYFNVTPAVTSTWRRKNFPEIRKNEFLVREKCLDVYELFERIYPKE